MSNYKAYLRKQPTYDEITGYIHFGQDRITYPDRSATFLRDSPYLGIYDGITFHDLEEQEQQIEKAKLMEAKAREVAKDLGQTHVPPEKPAPKEPIEEQQPSAGSQSSDWMGDSTIVKGVQNLRRRLRGKTPPPPNSAMVVGDAIDEQNEQIQNQTEKQRSKIREVSSLALATTGQAVKSTAGVLGNVVSTALNAGQRQFDDTVQFYREGLLNMQDNILAKIGIKSIPHIMNLVNSPKPTYAMVKDAIQEGIRIHGVAEQHGYALTGPMTHKYLSGEAELTWNPSNPASSSSSSSPPQTSSATSFGTGYVSYKTVDEWLEHVKNKGMLYDQLTKRPNYHKFLGVADTQGYNVDGDSTKIRQQLLKLKKQELAQLIVHLDQQNA